MTITSPARIDSDELTAAYRADLHARCSYFKGRRFRECSWAPSGNCNNCGRARPTMALIERRMLHGADDDAPVLRHLRELADEFDAAAAEYAKVAGSHNALLRAEASRGAGQLRLVHEFVRNGVYTQSQGVDWVRAAHKIICAIGRANLS